MPVTLASIEVLVNIVNTTVSATLLSDGRVAVTLSMGTGVSDADVFQRILDPRIAGISVTGRSAAEALVGSGFDDSFTGIAFNDTIFGDAGNDTIVTGPGQDLAFGGAGNDVIFITGADADVNGGTESDTANYSAVTIAASSPGIYADLTSGNSAIAEEFGFASPEGLLIGIENLAGSGGADFLAGGTGADLIRGGRGADFVMGRAGADTLFGGEGTDTFIFAAPSEGGDLIRDFGPAERLAFAIGGFGDVNGANIAFRFTASATAAPAANASAQFLFDNAGAGFGQLFFDADGNGAGAAVLMTTLQFSTASALSGFGTASFLFF